MNAASIKESPSMMLPIENWLSICEMLGETSTALAHVCRRTRAPAYEYIFKALVFKDVGDLVEAANAWSEVGGRVLALVKELNLGVQIERIQDGVVVHCNDRYEAHLNEIAFIQIRSMRHLTRLNITGIAIGSKLFSAITGLQQLCVLSLENVCVVGIIEKCELDVMVARHVRLVNSCWHSLNVEEDIIRGSKNLKTLEMSWRGRGNKARPGSENWENATCESLEILSRRGAWSTTKENLQDERREFMALIRRFKAIKKLHIRGWLPNFNDADTGHQTLSDSIAYFVGPVHFMKLSRRLPNLGRITLSDNGLNRGEVNEVEIQVQKVTILEVNVYVDDKETICMMLAVMANVHQLKLNFVDDVNEPVRNASKLFVRDMLDYSPPIERLFITADDPFVTEIPQEHFRALKAVCPRLKDIRIGQRSWRTKQGLWTEYIESDTN
ncbi:hypothetical protein EV359DRAFT_64099 [Lentinula novae-zelandiae]|nr:hypothetical protein EV359DRAFT_67232 [Lentinula novae-zelandiae]KAJ3864358.1 hypothetical protein EV359DRAFT_64099 [Lentinula novae-zelandiae]